MMPTHRKNKKRTVVPFATNEPSPVGPDPSINVPSVPAEVVVHCEPSKESTVLEKTQDIDTDKPSSCGLRKQQEQSITTVQQHVIVEKHELEAREEILNASFPTDKVTHQEDQDEDQPKSKKIKKGMNSYIFTDAQEVDLSEWYKDL